MALFPHQGCVCRSMVVGVVEILWCHCYLDVWIKYGKLLKYSFQVQLINLMRYFLLTSALLNVTVDLMHEISLFPALAVKYLFVDVSPSLSGLILQPLQSHCCASLLMEARRRGRPRSSIPRMADRGHGKERWAWQVWSPIKARQYPSWKLA